MSGREHKVFKKIVWSLNDMTKEKIEEYKVSDQIDSPSIEIVVGDNVTKWHLQFYPGGHCEESKDYIGLFLRLDNNDSTELINVKYVRGIVGKENKTSEGSITGAEFKDCKSWGAREFLKREELCDPNKEFLTDGKLTIFYELTITAKKVSERNETSLLNQGLLSNFKAMLENEVFADFAIKTNDGHDLKAHKAVLIVRSSAFKELLTGNAAKVSEKVLEVAEDASIMKQVLRFIYCNEIDNLKEIASKLIVAAENYELEELKKLCIKSMIASLTIENVLQTLSIAAELTQANKLKEKCFDMISSNFHRVSSNAVEWKKFPKQVYLEYITHNANKGENTIHIQGVDD